MIKNIRILKDVLINLIASFICTASLNLIVYPSLAMRMNEMEYGDALTIIGLINLAWSVIGNCLNNTRLLLNKDDRINNSMGNYNSIIGISSIVGAIIGVRIIKTFITNGYVTTLLIFFTIIAGILRQYYIVSYRISLEYNKQLVTNIIAAVGYIGGVMMFKINQLWPISLLLGETSALIYTLLNTKLINEPFHINKEVKIIGRTFFDLFIVSILGNIITYFDRFFINPVLGSASVAVYSVAAFWGKSLSPFIAPTANVILSYLSQKETKVSQKMFISLFLMGAVPVMAFGILGIFAAPWITGLLYPTLIAEARQYISLASFGCLVAAITNLVMPIILSVCNSGKILVITSIHFIFYLLVAYVGAINGGLKGFCVATCVISLFKVCLYFSIGIIELNKKKIEV